jgi:hypothetical protein
MVRLRPVRRPYGLLYSIGGKWWKATVELGGTWWTYVTCEFYRVVKLTNHNFLSPGWKIAISSLSTSALAALKI